MSAQTYNLLAQVPELLRMGIEVIRISPQPQAMAAIINAFDAARQALAVETDPVGWASEGLVNGYWFGNPGIVQHP